MLCWWPSPQGTGVKDWVWIWDSENLFKSNKAATFRACNTGKGCAQTTSSLRSLLLQVLPPHPEHILMHFKPAFLHLQIRMQAVLQPQLSIYMYIWMYMYVYMSSHDRGLKGWLWDSEQLIRSTETSMFYRIASNYRLIDVVTLTDAWRGHMVFLTKLTDHWSSNLALNDMRWFNMTESYKLYAILHCIWKPCMDQSVGALRQSEPVLYCKAGSDWLQAYRIIHALGDRNITDRDVLISCVN